FFQAEGGIRGCHVTGVQTCALPIYADLVIGAVLVPGAEAPKLITRDMVMGMKRGSVIVDISIDQGGCAETSRPTTHAEPTFIVEIGRASCRERGAAWAAPRALSDTM